MIYSHSATWGHRESLRSENHRKNDTTYDHINSYSAEKLFGAHQMQLAYSSIMVNQACVMHKTAQNR